MRISRPLQFSFQLEKSSQRNFHLNFRPRRYIPYDLARNARDVVSTATSFFLSPSWGVAPPPPPPPGAASPRAPSAALGRLRLNADLCAVAAKRRGENRGLALGSTVIRRRFVARAKTAPCAALRDLLLGRVVKSVGKSFPKLGKEASAIKGL